MLSAEFLQKLPEFLAVISEAILLGKFFKKQVDAGQHALEDILKLLGLGHFCLQHLKVVVLVGVMLAELLGVFGVEGASEGGF